MAPLDIVVINMETRVLIIGAGPAGSIAAYRLASRGFSDFIIVDRCSFPRMKPCAGGIAPASMKILEDLGISEMVLSLKPSAVLSGMRLLGPRGQELIFPGTESIKAITINRRVFDTALLNAAIEKGATFVPGFHARKLLTDETGNYIGASDGTQTIHTEVIICATGGHNRLFTDRYFFDTRPPRILQSRIGWWRNFPLIDGKMEMIFDKSLLPHYGWIFPEGDGIVNIGICCYRERCKNGNITQLFQRFLTTHYARRLETATPVGKTYSFLINTSNQVKHVYAKRLLLAGEAGRMCNPATAEGISFAMESGMLAADAILDALTGPGLSLPDDDSLMRYEKMCRRAFNRRLRAASLLCRGVNSPIFNWLITLGKKKAVQRSLPRLLGDM